MNGLPARVLLVESEASLRAALIDLLEAPGARGHSATCPATVLAALDECWPQMVIIGPGSRARADLTTICAASDTPALLLSERLSPDRRMANAVADLARAVR